MFEYIKSLISADTKERVSAFLAVMAGVTLCIGFSIVIWQKDKKAELAIISGGLVVLATFSKVDTKPEL